MKKVLITGITGLLGSNIVNLWKNKYDIYGISRSGENFSDNIKNYKCDITDKNDVITILQENDFDLIIHTAALTNVDLCENHYEMAMSVNAEGTKNISENFLGKIVYISTDMLYDGTGNVYSEKDQTNPINNYGKSKLKGEEYVSKYANDFIIVRTNFFGWNLIADNESFAEWLYKNLKSNEKINLFDDIFYTPIYVEYLINIIELLLNKNAQGIYNIAGKDKISKYEFGMKLANEFDFENSSIKKSSFKNNVLAKRPHNMALSTEKLLENSIEIPTIDDSILQFKKNISKKIS